ncbi:ABC transporter ATP-binding protein [filamentous cyanobacterium LEGE 11480]|uniref:ABC transporter ATP-binding protein n=1 Tax=Romeriopsis navalis LEGE 11480 TaxID=2777977 RepID=A0A928VHC2_9CYAN|nr:ABC transporter ATP-binding protein [Romeriopsis navalis]MBE9028626.1 ABC transporter ATP-binding protein [Romeriopsis navalis LEGE 11480]
MSDSLLSVANLSIAYPRSEQWVVDNVSFQLKPGERIGLVGESGCGKSTLGRAILKMLPDGSRIDGDVLVNGQSTARLTPAQARRFRGEVVSLVFQDPMTRLNPLLTIGDHCIETLLSHEPELSQAEAKQRSLDALTAVNIPADRWKQYPHEFSGGMRQRVAIALALLLNPQLIVADEPTTSLDVTVSAQILDELTRLCNERQMALVLVSHDLAVVGQYCDRIAVMYDGKIVELGSTEKVFQTPEHPYTKTLLKSALYLESGAKSSVAQALNDTKPLLKLSNLKQHYSLESNFLSNLLGKKSDRTIRAVDGIDLEIYPGETLGLVGESGCGKSTLSRTILQLIKPTSGNVEFAGQNLSGFGRQAMQQQRREIQMIFQDPRACLNPRMTVGASILDPLLIHKMAAPGEGRIQVEAIMERVGLDPTIFFDRYPGELSGGQQQRVAIARALITKPRLVICDEPVSMLDATVRTQVLDLMRDLKAELNLTYLFITHDLWVARFFCDRIAVMNGGKIIELDATEAIFKSPQAEYTKTLLGAAPLLSQSTG